MKVLHKGKPMSKKYGKSSDERIKSCLATCKKCPPMTC